MQKRPRPPVLQRPGHRGGCTGASAQAKGPGGLFWGCAMGVGCIGAQGCVCPAWLVSPVASLSPWRGKAAATTAPSAGVRSVGVWGPPGVSAWMGSKMELPWGTEGKKGRGGEHAKVKEGLAQAKDVAHLQRGSDPKPQGGGRRPPLSPLFQPNSLASPGVSYTPLHPISPSFHIPLSGHRVVGTAVPCGCQRDGASPGKPRLCS